LEKRAGLFGEGLTPKRQTMLGIPEIALFGWWC